jgi:hypothetical protein
MELAIWCASLPRPPITSPLGLLVFGSSSRLGTSRDFKFDIFPDDYLLNNYTCLASESRGSEIEYKATKYQCVDEIWTIQVEKPRLGQC